MNSPTARRAITALESIACAALLAACTVAASEPSDEKPGRAERTQNSTRASSSASDAPAALGEIVAEIDDSCWVVFQDKDDNYWFGSDGRGVSRYDGKTITRFTTKHGLSHDQVRSIRQHGPTGHILVETNGGVSRFDGERFVTLPVTTPKSPDDGWVLDPNDVWISSLSGVKGPQRYDGRTLYVLELPKSPHFDAWRARLPTVTWDPYEVWCIYSDRSGHLWFGTAGLGLCRFDGTTREWMFESHLSELAGDRHFGIRSILQDRDGAFWICNTQFRFLMQPRGEAHAPTGQVAYTRQPGIDLSGTTLSDPYHYFMSITDDDRGHLWMATYMHGVFEYDGERITRHPVRDDAGADITMFSIYRDRRGVLWVGTHEHGPYRFNGKSFERFRP